MTTANTTKWVDHDPESTYQKEDPDLSKEAHDILIQYSGIPEDRLVSHVREVVSPASMRHDRQRYLLARY